MNVAVQTPNWIIMDGGYCTSQNCPSSGSSTPASLAHVSNSRISSSSKAIMLSTTIPTSLIEESCSPLIFLSQFYYSSCLFDVAHVNNPNFANVLIQVTLITLISLRLLQPHISY